MVYLANIRSESLPLARLKEFGSAAAVLGKAWVLLHGGLLSA